MIGILKNLVFKNQQDPKEVKEKVIKEMEQDVNFVRTVNRELKKIKNNPTIEIVVKNVNQVRILR